ncbi:MAG: diguanylate cyclase [Candidatus Brocadia sp.]|jgi:diguanylate cyclase (GGDEF)-like protein/PAS domain S-box-containing protein
MPKGESEEISKKISLLEAQYLSLAEAVVDAIISIDEKSCIIFCNSSTKKMFGYGDEIIGKDVTILMPERYRQAHRHGLKRYIDTGLPKIIGNTVELVGLQKDGTEFPIEMSLSVWRNDEQCFFTGIIRDITERKRMERCLLEANKKLEELSIRDSLTNVYNRRYVYRVLDGEFQRAKRYKRPFSCLLIDVDYFKKINDQHGHLFGDRVLVDLASVLLKITRSTDVISRFGGEEFLVILPDIEMEGALDFAERVRCAVSKLRIEDKEKSICTVLTVSIGISTFTVNTSNVEELINQADIALYEAKRLGRNRVCCYSPDLKQLL